MSCAGTLDVDAAFARYEAIRHRLPGARFPGRTQACGGLIEIAGRFDAFVLDGFGVLNVGEAAIPGAVACIDGLRAMGKRLIVLTNAASHDGKAAAARYRRMGFGFADDEVVSSRDVCARRLDAIRPGGRWGAIGSAEARFGDIPAEVIRWTGRDSGDVDGFVFLSSAALDEDTLAALESALRERPRPLVVANPDLVAPRETGLSREPGYYANRIADRLGIEPVFFGKPFAEAYDDALARLDGIAPGRIAMVGDSLHTDILGGCAAGLGTVLVREHGFFAGRAVDDYVAASGIVPQFSCPSV